MSTLEKMIVVMDSSVYFPRVPSQDFRIDFRYDVSRVKKLVDRRVDLWYDARVK